MSTSNALLANWFDEHRRFLWGLSYRITGSAADADDVVQETFIRALQHAPAQLDDPRRWLVRVAVNVGRDLLRRRKRRGYVGEWLPTPIETARQEALPSYEPVIDGAETSEGRYDLMESVSLAFLQALEALTPTQRAVLLLGDVFDYSALEISKALEMSEGNARALFTTAHARRWLRTTASVRCRHRPISSAPGGRSNASSTCSRRVTSVASSACSRETLSRSPMAVASSRRLGIPLSDPRA
jgi:RNA polymerase sigma-70 factor (ECF subfamily)